MLNFPKKLILTAALVLGAAVPATAQANLSGNALTNAISGKAIAYAGGPTQRFNADGSMTATTNGLRGNWEVRGSQLCTQWAGVGSQSCFRVAQSGQGLVLTSSDGRKWNATYK